MFEGFFSLHFFSLSLTHSCVSVYWETLTSILNRVLQWKKIMLFLLIMDVDWKIFLQISVLEWKGKNLLL